MVKKTDTRKRPVNFDANLQMRVSKKALNKFIKKSEKETGKPYAVFLREIIDAFNEDRLRIIKPDGQTNNIYVTD